MMYFGAINSPTNNVWRLFGRDEFEDIEEDDDGEDEDDKEYDQDEEEKSKKNVEIETFGFSLQSVVASGLWVESALKVVALK
ncbi:hypothetical protein RND71_000789 [Anisodus tanguticus]|uniref:Uncharacterized protein n=1 Tax=Anisodus tanguticus TaxID=243964 RepID=A0AAE1SZJ5_9SOLA|nr:hypothetical protein RND71_000789 [Anisodus tanguticus]